ncbi:MAG: TA system VapC family ribonuclease toxin, partial [Acidobacteriota bacterium]
MSVSLLDVSILLPLIQGGHLFHPAVKLWFQSHRKSGWATCTITQAGFVRITGQTMEGGQAMPRALEAIELLCSTQEHQFWPLDYPLSDMSSEIRERIRGPKQLTDAILLDLAIRRGGRFATLDR